MSLDYFTENLRKFQRKSPEGEGPLFVTTQSVAVDRGGARHSIQVMGTVGKSGHPLAVSFGFLLPVKKPKGKRKSYICFVKNRK